MRTLAFFALSAALLLGDDKHPLEQLIDAARLRPPAAQFPGLVDQYAFTPIDQGVSFVWGQDFLFAIRTDKPAELSVNHGAPVAMERVAGTNLWYRLLKMRTGVTHAYRFHSGGQPLGQRFDVAGYNPDSYPKPGVPKGKVSEKQTLASKTYPGMNIEYWFYASPGVDASRPAALMVWQDGHNHASGDRTPLRLFTVTENLVQQKLIPPMVHVLISPPDRTKLRSIQYDTVSDLYGKFVLEEILPLVEKSYRLRPDAYSRGIAGQSSGAIAALNAAWYYPRQFSRVLSTIGSYTALQWRYGQPNPADNLDGGNIYPSRVRREPKKNIRVWMSDGADDNESRGGSWPLQNIQMANSFKLQDYDFHFRFGEAAHSPAQGGLDMPEALAWLWRDYDPQKTEQMYEQDPAEKAKPLYRVRIANRDAW
jgi:Putative esterase